ncbi:MAG: tyrosine--tRNA ligase, partial [Thermoleophilia bacterium]|nr:tyrosine--tRNA ligase [Thermoleophilia bacterium]
LVGIDGEQKMSKSHGNYIGVSEPPDEMFGKVMSIPDDLMVAYFSLLTGASRHEVEALAEGLRTGEVHPARAKRDLAQRIVSLYHGAAAAAAALERFDRVFKQRDLPEDMPEVSLPPEAVRDGRVWLPRLLVLVGLAASHSEARRLMEQGGVRLNDDVVNDPQVELEAQTVRGAVLQVGRRKFVRLK